MQFEPMKSAPRDETLVKIRARGRGTVTAFYVDCTWLREPMEISPGVFIDGDPSVRDCWRTLHGVDIELNDAQGWRPVK